MFSLCLLLSSGAISALLLSSLLSLSPFCSHSFSIVEFSKFSLRYILPFKFRMLVWIKTGQKFTHPHFIFLNYWHLATPVAGLSLKLLQQNSLNSLLFSTWFLYYKVSRKYQSYWNKKSIILMDLSWYLTLSDCIICALIHLPRTLQFCTEIPIYISNMEDRWVIACPTVCSRMCRCGYLI